MAKKLQVMGSFGTGGGSDGSCDYVLTDDDKTEIAEIAADLVDVSGSGNVSIDGETLVIETLGGGITEEQIAALNGMFKVCAFAKADVSAEYNAFKTAFGIGGEVEPDVPIIPSEYQQVEYIEFDGNSRIVTDHSGVENFRFTAEVEFPAATSERCIMTLGATNAGYTNIGFTEVEGRIFFYTGATDGNVDVTGIPNLNTSRVTIDAYYNYGVGRSLTVEVDGTTYTSSGSASKAFGSSYKFVVGNGASGAKKYAYIGKIYSASYYTNDVLVCDLVPCYRKADNVIGMYDIVNNKFYINSGDGTFGKGADVA